MYSKAPHLAEVKPFKNKKGILQKCKVPFLKKGYFYTSIGFLNLKIFFTGMEKLCTPWILGPMAGPQI